MRCLKKFEKFENRKKIKHEERNKFYRKCWRCPPSKIIHTTMVIHRASKLQRCLSWRRPHGNIPERVSGVVSPEIIFEEKSKENREIRKIKFGKIYGNNFWNVKKCPHGKNFMPPPQHAVPAADILSRQLCSTGPA